MKKAGIQSILGVAVMLACSATFAGENGSFNDLSQKNNFNRGWGDNKGWGENNFNRHRHVRHFGDFQFPRDKPITTPVPEPETYAMLLAGLGVMGAVARRRKQKSA